VSDPDAVENLTKSALNKFGRIHVLVNNAAIQVSKTVIETTVEEWNRQMAVNVGGVFLCSRGFLPHLRQTRGVIINLSSVNAFFVEPACAGYCATKAAIIGLTKAMAIDHGRQGVRVHAICPGYIDAGLAESYFQSQADPARAEPMQVSYMPWVGSVDRGGSSIGRFPGERGVLLYDRDPDHCGRRVQCGSSAQRGVDVQLTAEEISVLHRTFLDYRSTEDFIRNPLVLKRAQGLYYWDTAGKRYLTPLVNLCRNAGTRPSPVLSAMREQMERMTFVPPLHGIADVTLKFVEKLGSVCPGNLRSVKPFSGGSEAVESALKFTRQYFKQTGHPGKYKFISRYSSYHGGTFGGMSASGTGERKAKFEPQMPGFLKVFPPSFYRDDFASWEDANRLLHVALKT